MPSNLLTADSTFPTLTKEQSTDEKFEKITSYLYMLLEQLRYSMGNLDKENFNDAGLEEIANIITEPVYVQLENDEKQILALQVTAEGLGARLEDAEGNITSLTATANSLTTRITNAEGDVSSLQQTATALQSRITTLDGSVSSLTQTVNSITLSVSNGESSSTIKLMRDGVVVKDTPANEIDVPEITRCMVGRSVDLSSEKREIVDHSNAKTILSIRNLWVDMPGETVRNVTLDVKEGEILGIGGLAGQGKLGIPNGVMGLYEAGGTVEFDGKPIPLNSPRKCLDASLAFVSEDRRGVGLLLDETLEWNVAFPAMQIQNKFLKKIGPITWRDEKAIHDITQKYINELMIKCTSSLQKARELSGGNQQKICLAKAFALEPRFLFVSEPTRGIDVGAKALVLDALRRFNRESGVTVVMISSELEELRQTCDRIAIVSGGRIAGILPATDSSEAFGALMVSQVK